MATQDDVQVSEAEREAATFRLREHFATGRLSAAEFQQRLETVFAAQSHTDLAAATADLPHDGLAAGNPRGGLAARNPRYGTAQAWPARGRGRITVPGARLAYRVMLVTGVVTLGGFAACWLLLSLLLLHGHLLVASLTVLALLAGLIGSAALGLAWAVRRLWRRGAWLEALPLLAGQPWLSRGIWAGRALIRGRSMWEVRARLRAAARP